MKKRILAGLTASVLAAACAAQIPSILSVSAAGSYDMQLNFLAGFGVIVAWCSFTVKKEIGLHDS